MKHISRKLALGLVLVILMSLAMSGAAGAAGSVPTGYSVTEVTSFDEGDREFGVDGLLYTRTVNDEGDAYIYRAFNIEGEEILDEDLVDISALDDDVEGVFKIYSTAEDVNNCGLVTAEGDVLIPCEAAIIKVPVNYDAEELPIRYLEVVYGEEQTEDEDEAFFFVTDRYFAFSAQEGDIFYTGYGRIYDLKNQQFVDGVTVDNPSITAVHISGDYFSIEDADGNTKVYDENGDVVYNAKSHYLSVFGHDFIAVSDNGYYVYELPSGDKLAFFDYSISGYGDYIWSREEDVYHVMDPDGEIVCDYDFNIIYSIHNGVVYGQNTDDVSVLVALKSGKEIATMEDLEDTDASFYYIDYGYWYYNNDDGEKVVIDPNGDEILTGVNFYDFVENQETDDGYAYYVINDGDYTLELDSRASSLAQGLISYRSDGDYGVYDLFSGEELIPFEYRDIKYGGGYIYAYDGDAFTVFKIELEY